MVSKRVDSINSPLTWEPPRASSAPLNSYRLHVNRKFQKSFQNSKELQIWTVQNNAEFWADLYRYLKIIPPLPENMTHAYDESLPMSSIPPFFGGHKLNYAENALFSNPNDDAIALIGVREGQDLSGDEEERVTFSQLRERVRLVASALTRKSVNTGDRVAALVSNSIWAMIIFLACASKGIIFTSINPDLGVEGCVSRLLQVTPTIMFADSDVTYKGKRLSIIPKVESIMDQLKEKPEVFIIPVSTPVSRYPSVDEFLKSSSPSDRLDFVSVPFNHPLVIVYSSGTTGAPKCIVHQHGIILNLRKVMFQIMAGHFACGCCCVCYDGSPMYPDVKQMIRLLEKYKVTYFGTSPRYLLELEISKTVPKDEFDISRLKMVNTTGAPLSADQYVWFYKSFPYTTHLSNTAGGTDTATSLLISDPCGTLVFGEMSMAALGAAVDIFDSESGKSIKERGESGEMVITKPFPSMPPFFWADPEGKAYKSSYFERFENVDVWAQSDWLSYNIKTGGYVMHGRSDGVLNPSGIRFGSGEIYAIVEAPPFNGNIAETLCVGRRRAHDTDEQVFLFIKMLDGQTFGEDLESRLRKAISEGLSQRHVPKYFLEVDEIPVTINGKKIEIAVKEIISGKDVKISSTVANPEVLKGYKRFRDVEKRSRASKL